MGKSVLFIMPYPSGEAASQRFRFEQYFSFLEVAGFKVTTQSFWSNYVWKRLYLPGNLFIKLLGFMGGSLRRLSLIFQAPFYSFIFIHREVFPVGPPIFEWIIAKLFRKKIIYDFDDAIWLPNTTEENGFISKLKWHQKVGVICRWSHRISCGNEYLAAYARVYNPLVMINPSTIDVLGVHNPEHFNKKQDASVITVGWTGSHSTLGYLKGFEEIFLELEKVFLKQIRLVVIADKDPQLKIESVTFLPWNKLTEIEDLSKIDIGIMPLPDNAWTRGKCGFKILQYMAMGIPAIASPVGVNNEIIQPEINGFLCKDQKEWLDALKNLISSSSLREKIGKAGRENVITRYSVVSNRDNFVSLFA